MSPWPDAKGRHFYSKNITRGYLKSPGITRHSSGVSDHVRWLQVDPIGQTWQWKITRIPRSKLAPGILRINLKILPNVQSNMALKMVTFKWECFCPQISIPRSAFPHSHGNMEPSSSVILQCFGNLRNFPLWFFSHCHRGPSQKGS